ncbi:oligosaccharide flippase family protein [Shewanella sp. 202IG2-18]|uniref:oligosaccharide flippase family protein n=1 Tax=Parashewanella hymeniacidonis TaxID=2807618 RepID=UPI00196107D7|nr:oligosaccharide flippase family protein [Parashewanella hymeniacidonis]
MRSDIAKDSIEDIKFIAFIVLGSIVAILVNVFYSRQLGPESYGDFKVAEAFFYLCAIFASIGGAAAAPKFLSDQVKSKTSNASWEYVKFFTLLILFATIVITAIMAILYFLHVAIFNTSHYHSILIAVLIVPVYSIYSLLSGVLQAANKLNLAVLPFSLGYGFISGCIFAFIILFMEEVTDKHVIYAVLMTCIGLLMFNFFKLNNLNLIPKHKITLGKAKKDWLQVSIPLMIATGTQYLIQKIDIFMIEILGSEGAVGHFAAAQTISWIFFDLEYGFAYLLAVKIVAVQDGSREQIFKTLKKCLTLPLYCALPFFLIIVVYGHEALSYYGHDTELAYQTLLTLCFSYIVCILSTGTITWLQFNGKQNLTVMLLIIGTLLNGVLNWLLLPIFDIEGAAIATAIAMIFISVSMLIAAIMHLNKTKSVALTVPASGV